MFPSLVLDNEEILRSGVPDMDAKIVTRTLQNGGHIIGKAACEVSGRVRKTLS